MYTVKSQSAFQLTVPCSVREGLEARKCLSSRRLLTLPKLQRGSLLLYQLLQNDCQRVCCPLP